MNLKCPQVPVVDAISVAAKIAGPDQFLGSVDLA